MSKSNWVIDPIHSEISFKVKHMMFTNLSGKFNSFDSTIELDSENFENSAIAFSANINSIDTNNDDRDTHLKSADFFDIEKYDKLTFRATDIKKLEDHKFQITGNLTIKEITKSIVLESEYSGMMKDPWNNIKIALSINGKINRKEFGLNWNSTLETGGILVGEEIKVNAEAQYVKN